MKVLRWEIVKFAQAIYNAFAVYFRTRQRLVKFTDYEHAVVHNLQTIVHFENS